MPGLAPGIFVLDCNINVIARGASDEAIHLSVMPRYGLDCFAALAMTRRAWSRKARYVHPVAIAVPVVPWPEIFFTILVDGIFTTFIARLFTNTSDAIRANSATSCV